MNTALHRRAIVLMVLCTLLWSMAGIVTRQLSGTPSAEVTFWRSVFAALFVAAVWQWQHGDVLASLRRAGAIGLVSATLWAMMFTCFMLALTRTTVANTLIVMSIAPLLTALLAALFLRERLLLRTWCAVALACIGMVAMFAEAFEADAAQHWMGMVIALGVPVAAALNFIVLKNSGQHINLVPAVLLGGVLSALFTLPFAWPFHAPLHDVAWLALLGCFQLGLPCMLLVIAARHLSAPEISLLSLLEVLLGSAWAWWGAGEQPSTMTLWGGAVVLGALIFNEALGLRRR